MQAKEASKGEEPSPVVLQPGQVVQDYEIVKPLGKGKFSIVYMAKHVHDGTLCALKKINIFDMMVPKQREKCLKEVKLLQSLDHPNIVRFLNSFVDSNELLIIVEWAEKGDLKRLIRKAIQNEVKFRECELWEYSRQLASALDHMHGRRIMHRDLKPANIFVATDGALKLGDLGLGRFFSSQTLEAFSKVGTPLYMSPEVLHGAGYDMRSDVWSLGCVLYELAMLRSPFKSDQQLSLYDLFVRISKGQYPPLPDTISAEFRGLVTSMLQLEPAKRSDCAQALAVIEVRVKALAEAQEAEVQAAQQTAATTGSAGPGSADVGERQAPAASTQPRSRPSPLLVMDDIVEKLKLLECEEYFLRPRGYPLLHRCFFAQPVTMPGQSQSQFRLMYELVQWLLEMLKCRDEKQRAAAEALQGVGPAAADASAGPCRPLMPPQHAISAASIAPSVVGAGDAAAGGSAHPRQAAPAMPAMATASARCWAVTNICWEMEEPKDLVQRLVPELADRGIQVSAEATLAQLRRGHGEGVCLIINELINQELVGRDFHFEPPVWQRPDRCRGKNEADMDLPPIDEELEGTQDIGDSDSQSACSAADQRGRSGSVGSCSEDESEEEEDFRAAVSQGSCAARHASQAGVGTLEPVHVAPEVDMEEWQAELDRVRPLLRVPAPSQQPGEAAGWQFSVDQARQLGRKIASSRALALAPQGARACCQQWQDELSRLQAHEDRLNARFSESLAKLADMRAASARERETVAALQERVQTLSGQLDGVTQDVEQAKADIAACPASEALHDPEQLRRLRQAMRRVQDEGRELEVRTRCLQRELFSRMKLP